MSVKWPKAVAGVLVAWLAMPVSTAVAKDDGDVAEDKGEGEDKAAKSPATAAARKAAEAHFKAGYAAYLEKNYAVCAGELLLATNLPTRLETRVLLYLATCQVPLGYRDYAVAKLLVLEDRKIAKEDKSVYEALRVALAPELDAINKIYVSLTGYGGSMNYSAGTKTSGDFFGGLLSATYHTWNLRAAGESDTIQLKAPLADYTQTQFHGDIAKWFGLSLQVRAGYTSINASETDLSNIGVTNLGAVYYFTAATRGGVRWDHSTYPNSALGSMTIDEGTASLGHTLLLGETYSLWGQISSETIMTNAPKTVDTVTGFKLRSSYERVAAQLNFTKGSVDLEASGWGGNEAFGVREDGMLVYNSLEEHQSGFGVAIGYRFSPAWSVRLAGSQETFVVTTPTYQATVVALSTTLNF